MNREKKLIGLCGGRLYEQNVMPFMQVLKRESEKRGFHLIIFSGSTYSQENTEEIIGQYQLVELIRYVDISALVIISENIRNESMLQKLLNLGREKNIPVFSLDRKVDGCYNLLLDNASCFEQMVRHVVEEHGCRRVNMIAGNKGHSFSEERIAIYRRILEENGIPFEEERVGYGNYWECPIVGVMDQFFKSDLPFPEAIVCANDIMAHAAISILNENNFEVPEDIIVTGYDGTKDGAYYIPSLTTGAPAFELMVMRMFQEVTKFLENDKIVPCDIITPVILKRHQSCGCEQKMLPKNDRRIAKLLAEIGNSKWHMQAMNQMIGESIGKQKIEDIFPIIQKNMDIWFKFYRYVCLKSELLCSYEIPEKYTEMTSILEGNRGTFKEIGKRWNISEFQAYIQRVLTEEKVNTILVHLLFAGKDVYGFTAEGFEELEDWQMKQCDEFAMFLSHMIQTVVNDYKMKELNENLYKMNQEVEKMSLTDSMTGLYNRRGFFQKMKKIIRDKENNGKYLYLFMVDMDCLKNINDNFGHTEGDFAIITLANVLDKMEQEGAVCARVGGDEFICSYVEERAQCYDSDNFRMQMESILKAAEGIEDKPYTVSASVGMIAEEISESLDLDDMINKADGEMYNQKREKRKRW